jgi:hypothetical protein
MRRTTSSFAGAYGFLRAAVATGTFVTFAWCSASAQIVDEPRQKPAGVTAAAHARATPATTTATSNPAPATAAPTTPSPAAAASATPAPAASATAAAAPANPESQKEPVAGAPEPKPLAKPYYVEFRARNAHNYGHTFLIHGRLNANGSIATKTVAGLHPATESPVPWMIGHFVAVPSETGASDGDTEDQYVLARFRVALTAQEYKKVVGYIKALQAKSPVWHAVLYNCNAFIGDIAVDMGMEKPVSSMLMPASYINSLKELNISKTTGVTGTPVKVQSAEQLRAETLQSLERRQKKKPAAATATAPPEAGAASPAAAAPRRPAPARGTAHAAPKPAGPQISSF